MRTITEEENPSDLVTSDVKNPPWGTEPQTPSTATGTRKSFPWTTYSKDYIGLPGSVAQPQRMRTAEHLPRGWPFETTHYAGTFRTPQVGYSRHGVPTPASVHRRNNPHARIQDPWHYPDKTYLVWKNVPSLFPPPRETQSAPPNILQNDKHRWFNTTYKTTFNARPLVPPTFNPKKNSWKPDRWRPESKAQTPALHWQTTTTHDFRGALGRPTTTERPHDMSWSNLSM
ncbi:uncharacterized protein LOC5509559 [Nematostella vectensis]|uniref:uncharacterized protein LOC5509559 n=1 Tax=Nematostella vectensis TaxID=45351 RepID=UPI001390308E|nr:uncharacterized protein LOC5509559 [Nematostella vectensis]